MSGCWSLICWSLDPRSLDLNLVTFEVAAATAAEVRPWSIIWIIRPCPLPLPVLQPFPVLFWLFPVLTGVIVSVAGACLLTSILCIDCSPITFVTRLWILDCLEASACCSACCSAAAAAAAAAEVSTLAEIRKNGHLIFFSSFYFFSGKHGE